MTGDVSDPRVNVVLTTERRAPQIGNVPHSNRFGALVVWLFVFLYWSLTSFLGRAGSVSQIPSNMTSEMWLTFILNQLVVYAPVLLFLLFFVALYERKERSGGIVSLLSSVGWTRTGVWRSVKWALAFLLILVPISFAFQGLQSLVAAETGGATPQPTTATIPLSALLVVVISAFATAVTEETTVRGYILDRLMSAHPSTLRESVNAALVVSVMMASYHAAPYLNTYGFSLPVTVIGLVSVFVYSIFLSFAYVKSRVRNSFGPILFHFLMDAGFFIVLFVVVG